MLLCGRFDTLHLFLEQLTFIICGYIRFILLAWMATFSTASVPS